MKVSVSPFLKFAAPKLMVAVIFSAPIMTYAQYHQETPNRYWEVENDNIDRTRLGHRFKDTRLRGELSDYPRRMDICKDVKENLLMVENEFAQHEQKLIQLGQRSDQILNAIHQKKDQIRAASEEVSAAQAKLAKLQQIDRNKVQLRQQHEQTLKNLARQIPAAQNKVKAKAFESKSVCNRTRTSQFGNECRKVRRQNKIAQDELRELFNKKENATQELDIVKNISSHLSGAKSHLQMMNSNKQKIEFAKPTLSDLERKFSNVDQQRLEYANSIRDVRFHYGKTALRAEKCEVMKFEAKKGVVFKEAIKNLAQGFQTCEEIEVLLKYDGIRGFAAKEAVNEAFQIYCIDPE